MRISVNDWLEDQLNHNLIPNLSEFIKIDNESREFDPAWATNGKLEKAVNLCLDWAKKQEIKNANFSMEKAEGKTPLLFGTVDTPDAKTTVMFYGHLDKQPPLSGWAEGLGPYTPVLKDGFLYGRGSLDDGYAFFMSLLIVKALQIANRLRFRVVFFFETDEESGSNDVPYYLDKLKDRVKTPDTIFVADLGGFDASTFYLTQSIRGSVKFELTAESLTQNAHSGDAGGIVPETFRLARHLLDRLERPSDGALPESLYTKVPLEYYRQAQAFTSEKGPALLAMLPLAEGVRPCRSDALELYLNAVWRPNLTTVGVDGLPTIAEAGNVLRALTRLAIDVRIPPDLPHQKAIEAIRAAFESTPALYDATVSLKNVGGCSGINLKPLKNSLRDAITSSCRSSFGKDPLFWGCGASIGCVPMFAAAFPNSALVICGAGTPDSLPHSPNERLNVSYMIKIAKVIYSALDVYNP